VPFHEMDEDTIAALNVTCRTLKGGETVMSVRQPSRLTAILALERRFAKEEEIERQVLKDEAERQAAEDEKIARERRYKPEHTQIKEAEARAAQQRELDALMAERDALAQQVKPVVLPPMPVPAPRRPFVSAPAAPSPAVTGKAAAARGAAPKVVPAKAAPAAPAVSAKEQARQALAALFEPVPAAEAPAPVPESDSAATLQVPELLTDPQPAAAATMPSVQQEVPAAPLAATQAPVAAAGATCAATAPELVAAPAPVVPADVVDEGDAGGVEAYQAGDGLDAACEAAGDDAGYEADDDDGDEVDAYPDLLVTVPTPAPEPAPAPIKRRNINLWGESTDFPRKSAPEKEPVVPGSNWPDGFVLRAGSRVPAPWETFAGGPKPPGIVKDPRPQFAVGAGEFQWSDEYLEDGES